jgi:3-methyladenine DNA glycosylase AlkC
MCLFVLQNGHVYAVAYETSRNRCPRSPLVTKIIVEPTEVQFFSEQAQVLFVFW